MPKSGMTSTRQTSTVTFAFEGQAGMEADMMVPQQGEAVILCVRLIAGVNESAIVELQNELNLAESTAIQGTIIAYRNRW